MKPGEFLSWFKVPTYKKTYVLGSFASGVTLYSQQVRALNLVAALAEEKIVRKGQKVVVVGAGAAGLTAAAAAAIRGARVTLLEELYGLMETQRNNRQRWIHPHIYDWPAPGSKDEDADLPVFGWSAAYAEQITNQIERQWNSLCLRYPEIVTKFGTKNVEVTPAGTIQWQSRGPGNKLSSEKLREAVIILAVGFGLEPKTSYQDSYWTEDDIDGSFRKSSRKEKWLVSGLGDGALTDLMRLCITRFRHGNIVDVFRTESGFVQVEEQLKTLPASLNESPQILTQIFNDLQVGSLAEGIRDMKREGVEVVLTGLDEFLYGPKASVLNRLIVRVLDELGAFEFRNGKTGLITPAEDGYLVNFGGKNWDRFDRVILRHGPKPRALQRSFSKIWKASAGLREKWRKQAQSDVTRIPQWQNWDIDFSVPELRPIVPMPSEIAFKKAVKRLGVWAAKLVVSKELRNDGSSTITYELKGLRVNPGRRVSGIRLSFGSTVGQYGQPEFDQAAKQAGFNWQEDEPPKPASTRVREEDVIEAIWEHKRRISGTVRFPKSLTGVSKPVNFALTIRALNADALSKWEFEQFYSASQRRHVDNKVFSSATEYMARLVWFPVETLKVRVTLPRRTPGPAHPSVFMLRKGKATIPVKQVIKENILQSSPKGGFWNTPLKWKREAPDDSVQSRQLNSSGQTWELSVSKPQVGAYYSLDWPLPDMSGKAAAQRNEQSARLRQKLLRYRSARMKGDTGRRVGSLFRKLAQDIHARFHSLDRNEMFAVTLLTYDERDRILKVVDSSLNGGPPLPSAWKFWLPFGLGLSGTCFKQKDSVFLLHVDPVGRPENEDQRREIVPQPYVQMPSLPKMPTIRHKILVAMPLNHPGDTTAEASYNFESARQRIAVIDIGSDKIDIGSGSKNSGLSRLVEGELRKKETAELNRLCQAFGREMVRALERRG